MENQKSLVLAIVFALVTFIVVVGGIAVYASSYEDTKTYEQPMIVINNYEVKSQPQAEQPRPSQQYQTQAEIPPRPTQSTYNYYAASSYYPVYSYYRHYSRYYSPYYYPRYIYASDNSYPYYHPYGYKPYQKKIYY